MVKRLSLYVRGQKTAPLRIGMNDGAGAALVFRSGKPRALARGASLLLLPFLVMGVQHLSFALTCGTGNDTDKEMMMQTEGTVTNTTPEEVVEVGNKICPVMGNPIDEETKATYEYKGKIYNFCCAGCVEEFKKDPEKYIKKIEEEKASGPQETEGQ